MTATAVPQIQSVRSLVTGMPLRLSFGRKVAEGGEAVIYTVTSKPNLLAKVYKAVHPARTAKVRAMLAAPPQQDPTKPLVAWPVDALLDLRTSQARGVLVPYARDTRTLLEVFTPKLRQRCCSGIDGAFLARVAANLAAGVHIVHKRGHVIGDINELNVLVCRDATVMIIDSDSFQINDGRQLFPCLVGRPEYTPPELYGASFKKLARTQVHDYFGLAVLIFRILMDGRHPFDASDAQVTTIDERIRTGRFPHSLPPPLGVTVPSEARLSRLPGRLAELFLEAFISGHVNPFARPNALTWERVLRETEPLLAGLRHK